MGREEVSFHLPQFTRSTDGRWTFRCWADTAPLRSSSAVKIIQGHRNDIIPPTVTSSAYCHNMWHQKTRMAELPGSKKIDMFSLSTWHAHERDGYSKCLLFTLPFRRIKLYINVQTGRETGDFCSIYNAVMASRGNNDRVNWTDYRHRVTTYKTRTPNITYRPTSALTNLISSRTANRAFRLHRCTSAIRVIITVRLMCFSG